MRALCIDNYYGEFFEEKNIEIVLKGINMPIFYKNNSYNLEYLEDNMKVSTDVIYNESIDITLTEEQFSKYFIDVAKTRQEQIDSIINEY